MNHNYRYPKSRVRLPIQGGGVIPHTDVMVLPTGTGQTGIHLEVTSFRGTDTSVRDINGKIRHADGKTRHEPTVGDDGGFLMYLRDPFGTVIWSGHFVCAPWNHGNRALPHRP